MNADREQLRQQMVAALPHEPWCHQDMDCCGCTCDDARGLAVDPLLPVVEAHTQAARADELTIAADEWKWAGYAGLPFSTDRGTTLVNGRNYVASWIRTRAAALRTHEGDRDAE